MQRGTAVLLLLVAAAALLGGCGAAGDPTEPPSREAQGAAPPDPPERPSPGPPPAWLETPRGSSWLAYSSYCWHGDGGAVCADYVAPACDGEHPAPEIRAARGESLTVHLGFDPTEVSLSYPEAGGEAVALDTSREPSWTAARPGAFAIFARVEGGDASYVGCLVLE